jgi:anti-sigma factor RsiW
MTHHEAIEQMAVERYLLGELDSTAREDFEEHMFECPDCALDARVATVFMDEAKAELRDIAPDQPRMGETAKSEKRRNHWFFWFRPVFAIPVFAALVMVIGYQNLVTIPAVRNAADQPVVAPVAPLSGATRGGARATVVADRTHGISVPVDIPVDPAIGTFNAYSFEIHDPQGRHAWAEVVAAPAQNSSGDLQFSIAMPGRILSDGTYSVAISGVGSHGEKTPIENYVFNVALTK